MSQLDTEIDENPEIFQFSKFYAVFLKNFQQTPEIGMLERVNKEKQFPKVFVISSITLNNKRTSYAKYFLRRTLQRFASKTPTFFCFQHHRF